MKLQGLVNSIYTLSVTTYHEEHLGTASLTISEDVTYNLKIAPG